MGKPFGLRYEARGSSMIGGAKLPWRAVSESYSLGGTADSPEATIFSFSYFRADLEAQATKNRPVIFSFNGGPGSSCIWLHLGIMSPTRVRLNDPLNPDIAPPHMLEDNPHSPLDVADIVMIDPVGTGFARLVDQSAESKYFGVDEDAAAIARFIEDWLTRYDRWQSPKYLVGESYGTLRCGALTEALMGGPTTQEGRVLGIAVDGVMLLGSAMLNGINAERAEPSALNLPTYAATRYYHDPVEGIGLEDFVEEAFAYAQNTYLPALYAGNRITEAERQTVARDLARLTGLPAEYLLEKRLLIDAGDFLERVCRFKDKDVGLYDSRYAVPHETRLGLHDTIADDAAMGLYVPPFVAAMNGAKRQELNIDTELGYNVITLKALNFKWNHQSPRTALQCLTAAMRRNKDMRIFFGTGRFDLVTTMGYARYVASRDSLPAERVIIREYNSGHMPYLGEESAAALGADIRAFTSGKEKRV